MVVDFRDRVLTLPFVSETETGTLDYWRPVATGDRTADYAIGGAYCARLLHFYREEQAQHIAPFILDRMVRRTPRCRGFVRAGFFQEACEAIKAAGEDASPALRTATLAQRAARGRDLPFVRRSDGDDDDWWCVAPSGDWSRDTATGRHFGALTALAARQPNGCRIFMRIIGSMASDFERFEESRGLWTGWATEIASIKSSGSALATVNQRAEIARHRAVLCS